MTDNQTIIVVGSTEKDGYGNLWVTPKGDGERVKIAGKREHLHPLFQQGQAISLKWETYMNKTYVADATPVQGQLPPPQEPAPLLPQHKEEINHATRVGKAQGAEIAPQAVGMMTKEIGDMMRTGVVVNKSILSVLKTLFGKDIAINLVKWYRSQALGITRIEFDGTQLPKLTNETPKES